MATTPPLPPTSETDILIIGGGPTGLTLACALALRGIRFIIIDRNPLPAQQSRAAAVHARTLEMLEPIGIVDAMHDNGLPIAIGEVRSRAKVLTTISLSGLPTKYSSILMIPQDRTERILNDRLAQLGHGVHRPYEFKSMARDARGITATLRDAHNALSTVRARYIIGCDGFRSGVRQAAGIAYPGFTYKHSFVLADITTPDRIPRDRLILGFAPEGFIGTVPLPPDVFRIIALDNTSSDAPTPDLLQRLLDARMPEGMPMRIKDVLWSSRFRIHHHLASRFVEGPVILAGDAAHVHSPAGGQGMNLGIRDAVSLAPALGAALKGAGGSMKDPFAAWEQHRREAAKRILRLTHRITLGATLPRPLHWARAMVMQTVASRPKLQRRAAMGLAGLDHPAVPKG